MTMMNQNSMSANQCTDAKILEAAKNVVACRDAVNMAFPKMNEMSDLSASIERLRQAIKNKEEK